jgi:hypothetical protein
MSEKCLVRKNVLTEINALRSHYEYKELHEYSNNPWRGIRDTGDCLICTNPLLVGTME